MDLLRESNLAQLTRRFLDGTAAAEGARLVDATPEKELALVLQSHWLRRPRQRNISRRDAVDHLIEYYSLLEVASIAGCVPRPMPEDVRHIALKRLTRPAVVRYYTRYYPLLLPQLFVRRLRGRDAVESTDSYPEFVRFLHVNELRAGEAVELFLWFLDGRTLDGYALEDVLQVFANGERLVRVLTNRREKQNARDFGVRGLLFFLQFCRELDGLLRSCDEKPALQSAFWHYHGYWFQQLGLQVMGIIAAVIESYRDYVGTGPNAREKKLIRATHADMDQAQRSMQRLVSGIYSAALDRYWLGERAGDTRRSTLQLLKELQAEIIKETQAGMNEMRAGMNGIGAEILEQVLEQREQLSPEVGDRYTGTVQRITDFGAFVEIMPGTDGLLHISDTLNPGGDIHDELQEGQAVEVKVISVSADGKIRLSRKALEESTHDVVRATEES